MAPRIADIRGCKKVFRGCQIWLTRVMGNKKFVFCRGQNVFWTKRSSAAISGVYLPAEILKRFVKNKDTAICARHREILR